MIACMPFALSAGIDPLHQRLDRHDQRWIADDPRLALLDVAELVEGLMIVVRPCLGDRPPDARGLLGVEERAEPWEHLVHVEVRVPDAEHRHAGELPHRLSVGADRPTHDARPLLSREPVLAPSHLEAGRQPLHVPLPRTWRRLVEVVHVEEEMALGRAEDAEVGQVRIPAGLDRQSRVARGGEIGGHRKGRATVVAEGRHQHAPVSDWHELCDPGLSLRRQQVDRVAPAPSRAPRRHDSSEEPRRAQPYRGRRVLLSSEAPRSPGPFACTTCSVSGEYADGWLGRAETLSVEARAPDAP